MEETVEEKYQLEVVRVPVSCAGLQKLSATLKNLREATRADQTRDDSVDRVTELMRRLDDEACREGEYYVQIHTREPEGYVICNAWLNHDGDELPVPEGVQAVTPPSPVPLFQILRPNRVNALEPDSPMGMSVFGMAIDQLKAADLVFDSYVNEFVLGKKRVMVPQSIASIEMQQDGAMQPIFDPSDVLIYVYQQNPDGTDDLKPLDMTLRAAEHEAGL